MFKQRLTVWALLALLVVAVGLLLSPLVVMAQESEETDVPAFSTNTQTAAEPVETVEGLPVVVTTPSPADELAELIPPSVAVALVDAIFARLEGNFLRDNIALILVSLVAVAAFFFLYRSTPPGPLKTQMEDLGVGAAATGLVRLRRAAEATPTDIDDQLVDKLASMMSERIKKEISRLLDERMAG